MLPNQLWQPSYKQNGHCYSRQIVSLFWGSSFSQWQSTLTWKNVSLYLSIVLFLKAASLCSPLLCLLWGLFFKPRAISMPLATFYFWFTTLENNCFYMKSLSWTNLKSHCSHHKLGNNVENLHKETRKELFCCPAVSAIYFFLFSCAQPRLLKSLPKVHCVLHSVEVMSLLGLSQH